jgi:cerevisin
VVYAAELQSNAPWGLARISHRKTLSVVTHDKYLYDPEGGKDTTVYIIDTGINIDHDDFEGRAEWGITVPQNSSDTDENGHGMYN